MFKKRQLQIAGAGSQQVGLAKLSSLSGKLRECESYKPWGRSPPPGYVLLWRSAAAARWRSRLLRKSWRNKAWAVLSVVRLV